jgi:hypothetical protein
VFHTKEPRRRTVFKLKKWLSKKTLVNVDDISLVTKGHKLENSQVFTDCFLEEDAVSVDEPGHMNFVVYMLVPPFSLYIKKMKGGTATICLNQTKDNVTRNIVISDLKNIIAKKTGFFDTFKLLYDQKVLTDGEKLSAYNVKNDSIIYML